MESETFTPLLNGCLFKLNKIIINNNFFKAFNEITFLRTKNYKFE